MSLMNVGVSALIANQQALSTTGHNIANVNTKGYSRQTVDMNAQVGQNSGTGYVGRGVQVSTIVRQYDELLGKQANAAKAASNADRARFNLLNQMQDTFAGGESGLGAGINNMMNAFADVQTAPTDATARNVVLTRMAELAARFRAANASLEELDYSAKQQINNDIAKVNSLAQQVASLNIQISRALSSGHTPNDLLDARETAINEINQYVQTSQVKAQDGSINLFIANSQALVLGSDVGQLSYKETTEYPGSLRISLYFSQPQGSPVELSADMVGGGEIAGLLKFVNDDLALGKNSLGLLAMSIGSRLNEQNNLGLTLKGVPGTNLFDFSPATPGYSNIPGFKLEEPFSAKVEIDLRSDADALVASDYQIVFGKDEDSHKLVRLSDGVTRYLKDLGASGVYRADGLTFSLDSSAYGQQSQSILFQPYNKAAQELQAIVHNPDDLAVASTLTSNISSTNLGTLQLTSLVTSADSQIPEEKYPVVMRFNADGTISAALQSETSEADFDWGADKWIVKDAKNENVIYQSGQSMTINGWSITLTGTPHTGDTVTVGNAKDLGEGYKLNAGNATAFLALRDETLLSNGTTLTDAFSSVMASIGTRAQSARYAAELSASVAASLEADHSAVSGVNLDEEAARLLQYQQAYQASAKIIQTAQTLFDSVLNAVGR
ncbi:MAG: flagellar hook-associated protein FlgK [Comamonadaceae bacterium]|nr:flagellar hook-associated protein FlgK [Comamonadaceae bacterium]